MCFCHPESLVVSHLAFAELGWHFGYFFLTRWGRYMQNLAFSQMLHSIQQEGQIGRQLAAPDLPFQAEKMLRIAYPVIR